MKEVYVLYDSRYLYDEDAASVYTVEDTLEEARKEKRKTFTDAVIVKDTLKPIGKNKFEWVKSEIIES